MTYNLFPIDNASPLVNQEPLVTMRTLGLIHTSNVAQPILDYSKVLTRLEHETKYQREFIPLPKGESDPGDGPYISLSARFSGYSQNEGEKGTHFMITWIFSKLGNMLACQAEELE